MCHLGYVIINQMVRKRFGNISLEKVVTVSFLANIWDVGFNIIVAYLTGSVTIFVQALQGGADLLSSAFLVLGVKRSKIPADKRHPYGHGREMYFWAFIAGLATFSVTATGAFYTGLNRFLSPQPIANISLAYLALVLGLCANGYALSLSSRHLLKGEKITRIWRLFLQSEHISTKTAFVLDLMGTVASLSGLVALGVYGITGDMRFDGVGAMVTGVALSIFALLNLRTAKDLLLGQSASQEVEQKIVDIVYSFDEVQAVLDLRTLLIGSDTLQVSMELHLQDGLDTDTIEQLVDHIEASIRQKVPDAAHIYIELETPDVSP